MASDLFTKSGAQGSLSVYAGRGASQRGASSKHVQAQSHSTKDTDIKMGGVSESGNNRNFSSLMTPPLTAPLNGPWSSQNSLEARPVAEEPLARTQALPLPGSSDVTTEPKDNEKATHRSQTPDDAIIIADIDQPTHWIETPDGTVQVSQSDQHPAPRNENGKLKTEVLRRAITRHKRDACRNELEMAQRAMSYPGIPADRLARIPGLVQSIQESPELRRQILHSRSICFQFLLLPRGIRDKIASHLFTTGCLELLRICSKLHDELEPLIGEQAICRISIGASTHVKPFPLLTAEETRGIDQVEITILRIFNDCFPEKSNIEHLSQFARHPLTRRCCRVTIVSYPEQCWKPAARILEILGMYIYFKTFILDVRVINPDRLSRQLLDPESLLTASSNTHPGFPDWHTISQPASWNDLLAAALLLQPQLGPFHLPRNQQGAVFHPLDFHRGLHIVETEQRSPYNPKFESFYVPFYDGVRPQFGLKTAMLFTRPISNPVQGRAPAPAPVPSRAITRSSESQPTQAAGPITLSQGAEHATQLPASQTDSHGDAVANPPPEVPNARQHPPLPLRQGDCWDAAYNGRIPLQHTVTHSVSWYEPESPGQQPFMSQYPQPLPQPQPRTSNVRAERPRQVIRQVQRPNPPARSLDHSRLESTDPTVRYPYAPTRPRVPTVPSSKPPTTSNQQQRPNVPNIHAAPPAQQLNAPPPQQSTTTHQLSKRHPPPSPPNHPSSAKSSKRRYMNPTSNNTGRNIAPRPSYPQPPFSPDDPLRNVAQFVSEGLYHGIPSSRRTVSEQLPASMLAGSASASPGFGPETAASAANGDSSMERDATLHHPAANEKEAQKQNQKKSRPISLSPPPNKRRKEGKVDGSTPLPSHRVGTSDRRSAMPGSKERPRQPALQHLMHKHDEGEDSEHSIEELEVAETLEKMREGSHDKMEEEGDGIGVVDRGRRSSGWRVMDLG